MHCSSFFIRFKFGKSEQSLTNLARQSGFSRPSKKSMVNVLRSTPYNLVYWKLKRTISKGGEETKTFYLDSKRSQTQLKFLISYSPVLTLPASLTQHSPEPPCRLATCVGRDVQLAGALPGPAGFSPESRTGTTQAEQTAPRGPQATKSGDEQGLGRRRRDVSAGKVKSAAEGKAANDRPSGPSPFRFAPTPELSCPRTRTSGARSSSRAHRTHGESRGRQVLNSPARRTARPPLCRKGWSETGSLGVKSRKAAPH